MVSIYVYILLGGFVSPDGYITSAGMYALSSQLSSIPKAQVRVLTWGEYEKIATDIKTHPKAKHVVIGYSGGGSRATWLSRVPSKPKIDLMVLYDPSPAWQMKPISCNVKTTVSYHNTNPMFFGLGGGVAKGCHVKSVDISENHMLVQTDYKLHQRTYKLVTKLANQ